MGQCSLTDDMPAVKGHLVKEGIKFEAIYTGDIYASLFTGAIINGKSAFEAAKIAADYTIECIKATVKEENHWYGAAFEPVLYKLIEALR